MHIYEVLRRPLITEKGTNLHLQNKYLFEVTRDATKPQVKEAVQKAFKVRVVGVNMIIVPGERRRMGRREFVTPPWKKAIVTLAPGNKIEIFEGV